MMIECRIRSETRKHPNATLNLFLTFSFSSYSFSRIPVAHYCDETYELLLEDTQRKRRPMDRWLITRETRHLQHAHHIFTTGSLCADFLRARYGLRNVRVLRTGINLEAPPELSEAEALTAKRENKIILFIGNGAKKRGVDVLLEAFRIFNRKNADAFTLHLVGSLSYVADCSDHRVRCHGYLSKANPTELAAYLKLLKTARLFVMPMREGPLPGVIKEAGLMYTPVIITNIWQASDIIQDGVNGVLVDRPLAADFADRMHALANDDHTWEEMARNSHRLAQAYTWEYTVQPFWETVERFCV
jgi:glycosyltransferase involved in cell wall biosynthesis